MGVLAYGYDSAFIGTTIAQESFQRDFEINKENKNDITSNITSIYSAGGLVGALCMYPFLELLGRRATVIVSDAIFSVGAVMCTGEQIMCVVVKAPTATLHSLLQLVKQSSLFFYHSTLTFL